MVDSFGSLCRYKEDLCPALAALVSPVQKKFASPYTISVHLFVPIGQQAGQAVVPGHLSLNLGLRGQQWGQH